MKKVRYKGTAHPELVGNTAITRPDTAGGCPGGMLCQFDDRDLVEMEHDYNHHAGGLSKRVVRHWGFNWHCLPSEDLEVIPNIYEVKRES